MKKIIRVLSIAAVLTVMLFAHTSVFAHRQLATEDAGVGAMGEMVVELGSGHESKDSEKEYSLGFAFVLGLDTAEIGVGGAYLKTPDDETGFGDLLFFAKILVAGKDEESGMFTIKGEALSTTGDEEKGLGGENWEFAGSAIFSKSISVFNLHAQFGYTYLKDGNNDSNSIFYGAAIDYGITKNFVLVAEVTGSHSKDEKPVTVLGGFVFDVHDMLALDLGIGKGLNNDAEDWNASLGLTFTY